MDVLAHAAAVIIEPGVRAQAERTAIESRLNPVLESGGPVVVLQPIVDLASGRRVGAEALSRFPAEWGKAPDVCSPRRTVSARATGSNCSRSSEPQTCCTTSADTSP